MKKITKNFIEFEKIVIEKLLDGDNEVLKILRKQYGQSSIKNREYTGHGFYTYFSIPDNIEKLNNKNFQFGDVGANIEGLCNGVGFLLFITNGKLDFLEGYTYGEEFPIDIKKYDLFYITDKKRNIEKLIED